METKLNAFKKKYVGDKAFYKRYIFLAAPMIAQNAISNFVSFLDNFMVGQLGPEAISAVATVNQLVFVFALAVFGAASAGSIYGAQYFGKGDHKGHMYTFRFKLYATILVTIIGIGIFLMKGTTLVSLFLTDAGNMSRELALDFGMKYASIILVGLVRMQDQQLCRSTSVVKDILLKITEYSRNLNQSPPTSSGGAIDGTVGRIDIL